jgi:MFS transporter, DHA2 family, methylenomycin A resistance protein
MSGERNRSQWLLTGVSLGFVLIQLDVTIVNVALRHIGMSLGSGVSGLQWIVNTYTLVFAALILTAGALGDRFGARRVFIAGFVIFAIGSLGCGLSTSMAVLISARAFQGIGAAVLMPCSLALINHAFTDNAERNNAVGIWAAVAAAAVAAGPVVGGALIAGLGWRSIFFVNVPLAVLGIWLVGRHLAETT